MAVDMNFIYAIELLENNFQMKLFIQIRNFCIEYISTYSRCDIKYNNLYALDSSFMSHIKFLQICLSVIKLETTNREIEFSVFWHKIKHDLVNQQ